MASHEGLVFVVGAGPDSPGLLTMRGHELIATADAVIYERRAHRALIPGRDAGGPRRFYVGPRDGQPRVASGDVRQMLILLARQGQRVVYLMHGDPLALGRGSDLAQWLHDAGVEFEIVPGVALGNAAATYSGIPLMSPTLSTTTIFASGAETASLEGDGLVESVMDWTAVARVGGTLVVRDARRALRAIVEGYAEAGMPGEMPVAAITRAGRASQQIVVGTVATIEGDVERAGLTGAITLVVGWTVLLRDELAWFDTRPLFGTRIVVAQPRHTARTVVDRLRALGAMVIELPEPRVAHLDLTELRGAVERMSEVEWLVFGSADAVEIFWEQLLASGRDSRALAPARVACIGPATAAALLDRGITVDVVQERFSAVALIDIFTERADIPGANLWYIGDDATAESLTPDLASTGAEVTPLAVYRE
ncbi:MAG TPA: SAM-dependent methyltransferase, partial [Candidatus Elarobacter sp.]|nr:SAM-dependent methyltransferase [Candidatus Elarobacter sp.]